MTKSNHQSAYRRKNKNIEIFLDMTNLRFGSNHLIEDETFQENIEMLEKLNESSKLELEEILNQSELYTSINDEEYKNIKSVMKNLIQQNIEAEKETLS